MLRGIQFEGNLSEIYYIILYMRFYLLYWFVINTFVLFCADADLS